MKVIVSSTHSDVFSLPTSSSTSSWTDTSGLKDVHLGGLGDDRVVGAADQPEQIGDFVEHSRAAAAAAAPERRDSQVRLADAVRADEAEPLGTVRKRVSEPAHRAHRVGELLVGVDLKVLEVAASIARRDPASSKSRRCARPASIRTARRGGRRPYLGASSECHHRGGKDIESSAMHSASAEAEGPPRRRV